MTDEQLGGATYYVRVSLDWTIGEEAASDDDLQAFFRRAKSRRAEALKKIKAHVKSYFDGKGNVKWSGENEYSFIRVSSTKMRKDEFDDLVDDIPTLETTIGGSSVEIEFSDAVAAGGKRHGKTRRSRKARSTRRRA
jgi:hypothetical protein